MAVLLTIYSEGVRSLVEAAEHALEMLAHRDQLLSTEEERDVTSEPRDSLEMLAQGGQLLGTEEERDVRCD